MEDIFDLLVLTWTLRSEKGISRVLILDPESVLSRSAARPTFTRSIRTARTSG